MTAAMRRVVCRHAERHLVWADSRMRSEHFRKAVVKPNEKEGEAASIRALGRVDFEPFRRHLESPLLVVTRGGRGASIYDSCR